MSDKTCPDGVTCHPTCRLDGPVCARISFADPAPGTFPDDAWPDDLRAANTLALLPSDDPGLDAAAAAVVAAIGPFARDDTRVADWPADEADLYRHGPHRDLMERREMVQARRARKAVLAVVDSMVEQGLIPTNPYAADRDH